MPLLMELLPRLLSCFLIGSVPFAVIAMRGTGVNILKYGSGNPGFNNVLRYSKPRAIITLLGDFGKGLFAVWVFRRTGDSLATVWLYGFAAVFGHCYSPWLKLNGGKGVATSAGVMVVLYPLLAVVCIPAYAAMRIIGGKLKWLEAGTIASLGTWLLFAVIVYSTRGAAEGKNAALMLLFLAWRHRSNFQILARAWTE